MIGSSEIPKVSEKVQAPPPVTVKRVTMGVLIAGFFLLLWLPTIDSFLNIDNAPPPNENRALAPFPTMGPGLEGLRQYLGGLESYYNDHFGFRKRLIRWNTRWKGKFFKEVTIQVVLRGKDGWLYVRDISMMQHFEKGNPLSQEDLQRWKELLEARRDWLAARGAKYIFVIAPDKQTIYPEHLPEWIPKLPHFTSPTRIDQFFAYMSANSTVEVVDLRKPLLKAKRTKQLYMSTDTHWNFEGSFIGYQEVINKLSKQWPGLAPVPITAFDRKTEVNRIGGDLSILLGQEQVIREPAAVTFIPHPELDPIDTNAATNDIVKFTWPKGQIPVRRINRAKTGKAIIHRDSYSSWWDPFMSYNFNEVIYVWQYHWNKAFVEDQKPDVIIDEVLERFFNIQDPADLMKKDGLK